MIYIFISCFLSSFFLFFSLSSHLYATAIIHIFFLFIDSQFYLLIELCAFFSLSFLFISVSVHHIHLYLSDFILTFLILSSCQIHFVMLQDHKHSRMQKSSNKLYFLYFKHCYCQQHQQTLFYHLFHLQILVTTVSASHSNQNRSYCYIKNKSFIYFSIFSDKFINSLFKINIHY